MQRNMPNHMVGKLPKSGLETTQGNRAKNHQDNKMENLADAQRQDHPDP